MQTNTDHIIRDCCEAEVAEFGKPDTICITVDDLREIVQRHSPGQCLHQIQEPSSAEQAAWHAGRAQAAPAAVAVPDGRSDFEAWATLSGYEGLERAMRGEGHYLSITLEELWQSWNESRAALAATPAAETDTLRAIAIEELAQLGYTFDGDKMMPPEFVGELMHVAQSVPCGCREGTCGTKSDRACRMTAEIAANTTPAAAAPVVLTEQDAILLNQAIELLEDLSSNESRKGNDCTAAGAACSAHAVQRLGAALLAGVSAPAAMALEPFGYVNTHTGQFFKDVEPCRKTNEGHWRTVFTAPQQADAREAQLLAFAVSEIRRDEFAALQAQADAQDAARYRWLRDEHIGDDPESISLKPARAPGLDASVDAAIAAQAAQQGGDKQ